MLAEAPPLPFFAHGRLADAVFAGRLLERPVVTELAVLPDHRIFRLSRLDVEVIGAEAGSQVVGRLYRGLTAGDYERLDAYQGVGEGLYSRDVVRALTGPDTATPEAAFVYLPTGRTLRRFG